MRKNKRCRAVVYPESECCNLRTLPSLRWSLPGSLSRSARRWLSRDLPVRQALRCRAQKWPEQLVCSGCNVIFELTQLYWREREEMTEKQVFLCHLDYTFEK